MRELIAKQPGFLLQLTHLPTVTGTATDHSGNTASCQFDIVVTDHEAPVITCAANIATP